MNEFPYVCVCVCVCGMCAGGDVRWTKREGVWWRLVEDVVQLRVRKEPGPVPRALCVPPNQRSHPAEANGTARVTCHGLGRKGPGQGTRDRQGRAGRAKPGKSLLAQTKVPWEYIGNTYPLLLTTLTWLECLGRGLSVRRDYLGIVRIIKYLS